MSLSASHLRISTACVFLLSSACVASENGIPPDGGSTPPDAGIAATSDAQSPGAPRGAALIVPIAGASPEVAIMTLYSDGTVDDQGLRLPTGPAPRKAAVRSDGREAAVVWAGSFGEAKGVTFIDLVGDPSMSSTVSFELDLNVSDDELMQYQQSPTDIIYVNDDELLITVRGPGADGAVPAFRTDTGWELGKLTVIDPGGLAAPLEVHGIPGTDDALVMTFPDRSRVYTIRRTGEGIWDQVGDYAELPTSSLRIAMHPEGNHAYIATGTPSDGRVSNPAGQLHLLTPGSDGAWGESTEPFVMSGAGSQVTIDPSGAFAIVPDIEPGLDAYNLLTINLSNPDAPSEASISTTVDGFLMRDFEIGPDGQMIVSLDLPNGGGKVLYTMVQDSPGDWSIVWGPTVMPAGVDDVAVAQVSREID
jgi:hypothetical protein